VSIIELKCLLSILDINGKKLSDSFDSTDGRETVVPVAVADVVASIPELAFAEGSEDDDGDGSGVPAVNSFFNDVASLEIESSIDAAVDATELYTEQDRSDALFLDFDCEIFEVT
jgi:hypothetical protein